MKRPEAGVTLIELMIAITLVAALSVGMLMAMRTSLLTLEKTEGRLQSNRRVMSVERIMSRQIGGLIPVAGRCPGPVFKGTPQTLQMVSSYSLAEGSRGEPRLLEFQVIPADTGGVRLIVNEFLYTGPLSTLLFCSGQAAQVTPQSFVLADRLAFCRLSYRESLPDSVLTGPWLPSWDRPNLPAAVRIEMTPLAPEPSHLPLVNVTVPIHITRDIGAPYHDSR
jgi:prepilin-type N-terminal cleavage/methylation domain-containing protein